MKDSLSGWIVAVCAIITLSILIDTTYEEENNKTTEELHPPKTDEIRVEKPNNKKIDAIEKKEIEAMNEGKKSPNQKRTEHYIHIIQRGETLYGIGKKYNVSMENMVLSNDWIRDKPLEIGDELYIPVMKE